jgi:pSer/pThr/pTyr-binding forkhead associated (FHA) protein
VIAPGLFIFARNARAPDPKHRCRASDGTAAMKVLQLTAIVRDAQTATMTAQSFTRSPVRVGRQYGNQLRLDAHIVSRHHGAFLFSNYGLQFIDYGSANGSYVDGVRVAPNRPIDVRNSSVITIVPFQIVAHIDLVEPRRLSNDPNASTPAVVSDPRPTPAPAPAASRSLESVRDDRPALRCGGATRGSNELWRRARDIMNIVAEGMLAAGSRTAQTSSPLRRAATRDEMIALLLEPAGGDKRLDELRELLAELLRPRLTSIP